MLQVEWNSFEGELTENVLNRMGQMLASTRPGASSQEGRWLFHHASEGHFQDFSKAAWAQVPQVIRSRFETLVERRSRGEPFQYLMGTQPFFEMEIAVGPGVFIPRPETEELLRSLFQHVKERTFQRALDLYAGSGAFGIGVTHLLHPREIHFVESSINALPYLARNVAQYVDSAMTLNKVFHMDVGLFLRDALKQYDLIVANPPYIALSERDSLPVEVVGHEPHAALFAGETGFDAYNHLRDAFHRILCDTGVMLFEHHETHQGRLAEWIGSEWEGVQDVVFLKDLSGKPRGIMVTHV